MAEFERKGIRAIEYQGGIVRHIATEISCGSSDPDLKSAGTDRRSSDVIIGTGKRENSGTGFNQPIRSAHRNIQYGHVIHGAGGNRRRSVPEETR